MIIYRAKYDSETQLKKSILLQHLIFHSKSINVYKIGFILTNSFPLGFTPLAGVCIFCTLLNFITVQRGIQAH